MAGDSHDVMVQALRDDPSLLRSLVARVNGQELPGPLRPEDSTVRLARPAEVRPDVVGMAGESWVACEVQNAIDEVKRRRWPLAVALLFNQTGRMGELVVITASPAVARWAADVAHLQGPVATSLRLSPLVVLLDAEAAAELLKSSSPELAWCAVWAVRHRHGPVAADIVERAIEAAEQLPSPLRGAQMRAIFELLSDRMKTRLRKAAMNLENIPESPATRKLRLFLESVGEKRGRAEGEALGRAEGEALGRAEGEALGRAASVLLVLEQRGLPVTKVQRARIRDCADPEQLDVWLKRALTAGSVGEVLAVEPPGKKASPRAKRRAPSRAAAVRARG